VRIASHARRGLVVAASLAAALSATTAASPLAPAGAATTRSATPAVPRAVHVTPGVGTDTVSWTAPTARAGVQVTSYLVTSLPSGKTCTTTATSCVLTGIVDRTRWRFAVAARDAAGLGRRSAWTLPLHEAVIVVVAGQSNATGAESYAYDAATKRAVFDGRSAADRGVFLSLDGPFWRQATIPPGPLEYPQVSSANHAQVLFGPEVGLARGLWDAGFHTLAVEKVVRNGSSLAVDWRPGGALFADLVARTRALLAWAAARGDSPSIGGIFWVQGEADALRADESAAYRANLVAFVSALRTALPVSPVAPFVIGETTIAPWVHYDERIGACVPADCKALLAQDAEVRAAQVAAAAGLRSVYLTDTAGLPRSTIQLHLSSVGELDLGAAFARISSHLLT